MRYTSNRKNLLSVKTASMFLALVFSFFFFSCSISSQQKASIRSEVEKTIADLKKMRVNNKFYQDHGISVSENIAGQFMGFSNLRDAHLTQTVGAINRYLECVAKVKGILLSGDTDGKLSYIGLRDTSFITALGMDLLKLNFTNMKGELDFTNIANYTDSKGKSYNCSLLLNNESLPKKWGIYFLSVGKSFPDMLMPPMQYDSVSRSLNAINSLIDNLIKSLNDLLSLL